MTKISLIKCKKCGYNKDESKVQLHHIVPKCIGGTHKDGRVYLCVKCHIILQLVILKWVWIYVNDKESAIESIKRKTEYYLR